MRGLPRYIASQIAGPFAVATLILTGIIWLTQALRLLDVVVTQGQTAGTYFILTMLALPSVLSLIVPISFFFAVLYALHRLYSDSELVVMFAAGVSRWEVTRPILYFALAVSVLVLALTMYLSPLGQRTITERIAEIRADVVSAVIQEGRFNTPSRGLTVYVREQGTGGAIQGILVHDNRDPARPITYMAENGQLVKSEAGPRLIMFNGNIQRLIKSEEDEDGPSVTLLYFDKYTYDLTTLTGSDNEIYYEASERYFHELLWPAEDDVYGQNYYHELFPEAHQRLATLLYPPMFAALALACLLSAEFSRRGYTSRIVVAVIAGLLVQVLALSIKNMAVKTPALVILFYLLPLLVILGSFALILTPETVTRLWRRLRAKLSIRRPAGGNPAGV